MLPPRFGRAGQADRTGVQGQFEGRFLNRTLGLRSSSHETPSVACAPERTGRRIGRCTAVCKNCPKSCWSPLQTSLETTGAAHSEDCAELRHNAHRYDSKRALKL